MNAAKVAQVCSMLCVRYNRVLPLFSVAARVWGGGASREQRTWPEPISDDLDTPFTAQDMDRSASDCTWATQVAVRSSRFTRETTFRYPFSTTNFLNF